MPVSATINVTYPTQHQADLEGITGDKMKTAQHKGVAGREVAESLGRPHQVERKKKRTTGVLH